MGRVTALFTAVLFTLGAATHAAAADARCLLQKAADLPVTMEGLTPMVPVKINGADTLMIADSGAFFSIITADAATRLGMKHVGTPWQMSVQGVNGSASVEVYVAKDFSFAGIPLHDIQFLVGGREFSAQAAGVLGQNVLAVMDVEYDLANGVIRLFKPKDCAKINLAYWAGAKPVSVLSIQPLSPQQRHILAKATVNGQPIQVGFDTGANASVLKRSAAQRVGIRVQAEDVEPGGLSWGFGRGAVESWISPVSNFTIGDEQVQNTRLRVGNLDIEVDMLLGADFFLSHRIYVSNSQHRLYFTYNGGPVFRLDQPPAAARAATDSTAPPPVGAVKDSQAPSDAAGFARRGSAFASRRNFPAAIADFTRAVELEPLVAQHYYDRAVSRLSLGQPAPAMADLDQALKLKPDDARGLEVRGSLYLSQGDFERARADLEAAVHAAPEDGNLRLQVATTYEQASHFDAAIGHFDAWIAAHPKGDWTAAAFNGRCWTRAFWGKELDKALADCNAALKLGLSNSAVLDSRGLVHLRRGELDAAIADYDAAIKLQPKAAWSLYGRGLARQKKGAAADGAADIKAALTIQPDLAKEVRRSGLIDEKAGGT